MATEARLHELWATPGSPCQFSGILPLYKEARRSGLPDVTLKEVKEFLTKQKTYTVHLKKPQKHVRQAIVSYGLFDSWQADLAYAPNFPVQNRQVKFFLIVVDCFNHFLYSRTLTKRTTEKVTEAMRNIFDTVNGAPKLLTVDKGGWLGRWYVGFFWYFVCRSGVQFGQIQGTFEGKGGEFAFCRWYFESKFSGKND